MALIISEDYLMQTSISSFINKRQFNKDVLKRRTAAAAMLGIFVIMAVFWGLKLTGITLAGEACCGYTEHTHTEECITKTLICGYEDDTPDNENDTVAASAFFLTVHAEEIETGEGTAEIITTDITADEPIIDSPADDLQEQFEQSEDISEHLPETEFVEPLLEENEPKAPQEQKPVEVTDSDAEFEQSSSEAVTEEIPKETVQTEEPHKHIHTAECYKITYTCGLEEHIHTSSCYSDDDADVETPRMWEETFEDVELTEDLATNLIAIAKTQLGYAESERNFEIDAEKEKHGYTRYGDWYGSPRSKWSAIFIEFCLHYSGIDQDALEYYAGVERLRSVWEDNDIVKPLDEHTPILGDIIFLDYDADEKSDLAGIISDEADDEYTVIVGDRGNQVSEITIEKDDEIIVGSTVAEKLLEAAQGEDTHFRVENVIDCIDNLPSYEEIVQTLGEYEASGDMDGYAAYFDDIYRSSFGAYVLWEDLWIYRPLVTNFDSLEMYKAFWVQPLKNVESPTVYQINSYDSKYVSTLLCYGSKTIYQYTNNVNSMLYWDMYVVSKDSEGYYVSEIVYEKNSKNPSTRIPPSGGFLLFCYRTQDTQYYVPETWVGVEVGDRLEVNVTLTTAAQGYNANGYGTISVKTTNNLTPIASVDTSDFITIDLFDYGEKINTKYNSNSKYPGFQQGGGTSSVSGSVDSTGEFNFGDNVTADFDAGKSGVGHHNDTVDINQIKNSANTPISQAMNCNLSSDGFPQLAYTASDFDPELYWLFSENSATSTTKVNSHNINGLFQYDETEGCYYFDSRKNTAQFNRSTGNFDLYAEHITPNYMMYPFGNFLPLNDINTQATYVPSINNAYFSGQAAKAKTKYNNGMGDEYNILSTALTKFVSGLNSGSFNYLTAVNKYFSLVSEIPTNVPENTFTNMYNLDYAEPSNFYFGMHLQMNFMMSKTGYVGPNGDKEMYFDFRGDDDIWIYIDNKLFLDLSGIHRHVGGRIDFTNARVEYFGFDPATGDASASLDTGLGEQYKENGRYYVPFSVFLGAEASAELLDENGKFPAYSTHKFDLFYMERGAGSSVCSMEFTMPILEKNSIAVTKDMVSEDPNDDISVLGNPDFNFQILKEGSTEPFIAEGTTYNILDSNAQKIGTGVTKANGVFTLKAGQTAVFPDIQENAGRYYVRELLDTTVFEQYGTITVDGSSTTTDHNMPDVVIGTDTFKGVNSAVKDISDGNTAFNFTNIIDIYEYGALSIKKNYNEYESTSGAKSLTLDISFGGEPIPVGTAYTLIKPNGTTEDRSVTQTGKITFNSDEEVRFSKMLAGTVVTVNEDNNSAAGYDVYYSLENGKMTEFQDSEGVKYTEILVPSGQEAKLFVTNERIGKKIDIPISKNILYPDGSEHTYTFVIEGIQSLTNLETNGFRNETKVTVKDTAQDFNFTLNYPPGTGAGDYYYIIYEKDANNKNGMDLAKYIVKVTVTVSGGTTNAEITGWYDKNGIALASQEISFRNSIVRSLTIGKKVQGVNTEDTFTFEIVASTDGAPLTDSYYYTKNTQNGDFSIIFESGKAQIRLKDGETAVIHGLPYGTEWTVTELDALGYFQRYTTDNGDTITNGNKAIGTLSKDSTVLFYNIGGYELPSTGSSAHLWFIITGLTLMMLPLIIGYIVRRRIERRLR